MIKLESLENGEWRPHVHVPLFSHEKTTGEGRLRVALPPSSIGTVRALLDLMPEPIVLLYVLHTPRGGGQAGRYQSPDLSRVQVDAFLDTFGEFLLGDGRHDLWFYGPSERITLVWDRHDILYVYGPLERFTIALESMGYRPGNTELSFAHSHNYHPELDPEEVALLKAFEWRRTDLKQADLQ